MMPAWFFALNHSNYAQWLPIHVRDMLELGEKAPGVAEADVRFSAIVIDQAHEQNNAMVKGEGGAADLTENPSALRRWMLSEMARLVNRFYTCAAPEINPGFTTKPRKVFRQHSTEMSSHLYKSSKTLR